jgi:hypothetical protein
MIQVEAMPNLVLSKVICFGDFIAGITRLENGSMQLKKGNNQEKIFEWEFIKPVVLLVSIFGFSVLNFPVLAADLKAGPPSGLKPLDESGTMHISSGDRCPVCAMQVSKHKKFACAVQLMNGSTFYFCGTGCMIRA